MVRAAAYKAKMNEASVGMALAGSIDFGLTSPAIENPHATKTLIAVTSEAIRIGVAREESGIIKWISLKNEYAAGRVGHRMSHLRLMA
jgi:hypothetical protein